MKKSPPAFGAPWVHSLYGDEKRRTAGLPPATIAKLRFTGGAPLPPSLAAALEHDASRATIDGTTVRAMRFADWVTETLPDWAEVLKKGTSRLFKGLCFPIASGPESGTFLYLGAADENGEYPVIVVDVDDVPDWAIAFGGYDAWLASDLGKARKGSDSRIAAHAERCFAGKKKGRIKGGGDDAFRHDYIVFGRVRTALDDAALRSAALKSAPTNAGFDLFFPPSSDRTLAECIARFVPNERLEFTRRDGEVIVRGDVFDFKSGAVPPSSGKLTAIRDWFFTVADGGAEFHFVARENRRPINAWRVKIDAHGANVKRLDISPFEKLTDGEEYLAAAKP